MKKIIVQRSIENKLLEFTENGDLWIKGCFTSNCQGDTPDPDSNPGGGGSLVGSGINFHRLEQYTPPVLLYNFENGLPPILSGNTEFNVVEKADPVTGTTKALAIGSEALPQPTTNLEVEAEIEWTDGPGRLQVRCLIEHAFTVYLNDVVIAEFPTYEVSTHSINNTDIRTWITIDVPITNGTNRLKFVRNRYLAGYWDYIVGVIYIGSIFKSIAQPHTASINTGDIVECEDRFYVALTDIVDTTASPKDNPNYKNIQGGIVPHGDGYQLVTGTPIYTLGEHAISLSDASESNGLYGAHGKWSATFGNNTRAIGDHSLAIGKETIASGPYSHAEGIDAVASGPGSHAEGDHTFVSAYNSHAEGEGSAVVPGYVARIEDGDITPTSLSLELDYSFIRNSTEGSKNSWHMSPDMDIVPGSYVNIVYSYRDTIRTLSDLVVYDLGHTGYRRTIEILLATIPPEKREQLSEIPFLGGNSSLTVGDSWNETASHAEGLHTIAGGNHSHAEGATTIAGGWATHAEGVDSEAYGYGSHAEGLNTKTLGFGAHSEGSYTYALGSYSHAEGWIGSIAEGDGSHAEGDSTTARGESSHTEGANTETNGYASHAEGDETTTMGDHSHAEGIETIASGTGSHTEGEYNTAGGYASHAEGYGTHTVSAHSHAEGFVTLTVPGRAVKSTDWGIDNPGDGGNIIFETSNSIPFNEFWSTDLFTVGSAVYIYYYDTSTDTAARSPLLTILSVDYAPLYDDARSHTITLSGDPAFTRDDFEGYLVSEADAEDSWYSNSGSHAEGHLTMAANFATHAEGVGSLATGYGSHAEGENNIAHGEMSHAEGGTNAAVGYAAHAEGLDTQAHGVYSHTEGVSAITTDSAYHGHAEGFASIVYGRSAHGEGAYTKTLGAGAHSEGEFAIAIGDYSHAEGNEAVAVGEWSHAEGANTVAMGRSSHAEGIGSVVRIADSVACINYTDNGTTAVLTAVGPIPSTFVAQTPVDLYGDRSFGGAGVLYKQSVNLTRILSIVENTITISKRDTPGHIYGEDSDWYASLNNEATADSRSGTVWLILYTDNGYHDGYLGIHEDPGAHGAHAEGIETVASGNGSHAEGLWTQTLGELSHAEGRDNLAASAHSHVEGRFNLTVPGRATALQSVDNPGNGSVITVETKLNTPVDDPGQQNLTRRYFKVGDKVYIYYLDDNTYKRSPLLTIQTADLCDLYVSVGDSHYDSHVFTLSGDANFTHTGFNDYTFMVSAITLGEGSWNDMSEGSHAEGLYNIAAGVATHVEGEENVATGYGSHAEGLWSAASGDYSHAEGEYNVTIGFASHAEGEFTQAHGAYSHTEGGDTIAKWDADYAHAEGYLTVVHAFASHAEGMEANAVGEVSHAEGDNTWSLNYASHAEGRETYAGGENSHAEGTDTAAAGYSSHAEGEETIAISYGSHAEGYKTKALSNYVIRCSDYTDNGVTATLTALDPIPPEFSTQNVEWINNAFTLAYPTVELYANSILYDYSSNYTRISSIDGNLITIQKSTTLPWAGDQQFSLIGADLSGAEVLLYIEDGGYSHAEGVETTATGYGSHAEGRATRSIGAHSHASGVNTVAHGLSSESTGMLTQAFGLGSHAEGYNTIAGTSDRTEKIWYQSDPGDLTGRFTTDYFYPEFSVGTELALYVIGPSGAYRLDGTFVVSEWYVTPDYSLQKYIVFTQEFPATVVHDVRTVDQFEDDIYVTTTASGIFQHAEGIETIASGTSSHAEGTSTQSIGTGSHTEGLNTIAAGDYSHAEGESTQANMTGSHAEGKSSITDGAYSHTEGELTHTTATGSHAEGLSTLASGDYSHAEGEGVESNGYYSHAEGHLTFSVGNHSHAEGEQTTASGNYSHAEGESTAADGLGSHAEGKLSTAASDYSHAEGESTQASAIGSHTEGLSTTASGLYSHAEGSSTESNGTGSHAEGSDNIANADYAHAEGVNTMAAGIGSHTEGTGTATFSEGGHAEGMFTTTISGDFVRATAYTDNIVTGTVTNISGLPSTFVVDAVPEVYLITNTDGLIKVEGTFVITAIDTTSITFTQSVSLPWTAPTEPDFSLIYLVVPSAIIKGQQHAEGTLSVANGVGSHAEGYLTIATGDYSHAEGESTQSIGVNSHAEGKSTETVGIGSHAEGLNAIATGDYSHAEGESTAADGLGSHAEGKLSTAVSDYSHAEGLSTAASGLYSHAEGYATTTAGEAAHTEGINTAAIGDYSHAEGNYTTVLSNSGHAEGLFTATVTGDFVRATAYIDNTLTGTVTGLSNLPSTFIVDAAPEIYLLTNTSGLIKVEGTFVITAADSSSITFTQSISLPWTLPTEPDFSLIYLIVPNATAKGQQHAEGTLSIANGDSSHTEGLGTIATGSYSHAEGESTQAVGIGSHAEGQNTLALGDYSHAAGINSQAVEPHSFAFGAGVETADAAQTVLGTYNIPTIDAALVIGNGTDALNLSNAVTVGWDGKITSAASSINIALSSTPATSTSPGTTGDICWDADYIYVCIATDTWKRSALLSW